MRYYLIDIDDGALKFTSHEGQRNLPGALQIELDIPVAPYATPKGSAYVKVWGIPRDMVGQAKNLNNKNIKVYGGFKKGLPLANPNQSGLLMQGYIFQAFGNWIGTEMSLDLIVVPGNAPTPSGPVSASRNLVINWKKGSSLADAVKTTLSNAFSGFTTDININSSLTAPQDEVGFFPSVEQFAAYVKEISRAIVGTEKYQGADIVLSGKQFKVYDGTKSGNAKTIDFKDLIGQPTWILAPSIQFKCGMRADLAVGDDITLPKSNVTNTQQAQSSLVNQKVNFQGTFQISDVHHIGNFRQRDASAWVTVFNAFPKETASA